MNDKSRAGGASIGIGAVLVALGILFLLEQFFDFRLGQWQRTCKVIQCCRGIRYISPAQTPLSGMHRVRRSVKRCFKGGFRCR